MSLRWFSVEAVIYIEIPFTFFLWTLVLCGDAEDEADCLVGMMELELTDFPST